MKMKKLLLIAIVMLGVSCSKEELKEDCICKKNTYETHYNGGNLYNELLYSEDVPCQDEVKVNTGGWFFYKIECD